MKPRVYDTHFETHWIILCYKGDTWNGQVRNNSCYRVTFKYRNRSGKDQGAHYWEFLTCPAAITAIIPLPPEGGCKLQVQNQSWPVMGLGGFTVSSSTGRLNFRSTLFAATGDSCNRKCQPENCVMPYTAKFSPVHGIKYFLKKAYAKVGWHSLGDTGFRLIFQAGSLR